MTFTQQNNIATADLKTKTNFPSDWIKKPHLEEFRLKISRS